MKNFKRVLALVLAVASIMALTISGAAFDDDASIQHDEAVGVLTGLGIIEGFPDKTFKPTNTVTRGQMAKMISVVLNEGDDIGDLYKAACAFPDAAADWSAGYVAYCAQEGIVAGKSETVFAPKSDVKGVEAVKMALCGLGYDATTSGLTGSNWAANTIKLAKDAGLLTNLNTAKLSEAMTRDEAAQLLLNALEANTVYYDTTASTIIVGETTIVTGGSAAKKNTTTWAEEQFPTLAGPSLTADKFGAPYYAWELDGKEIAKGEVAQTKLGQNASTIKISDIYTMIGKTAATDSELTVKVYMDGKDMSITPIDLTSSNKNTTAKSTDAGESVKLALQSYATKTFTTTLRDYIKLDKNAPSWKNADVYYDAEAKALTIVITNKYYGAVSALSSDKKTVTVTANNRFVDDTKPIDDTYLGSYTTQAPAYAIQKFDLGGSSGMLLTFDYKASAASTLKVKDVVEYTLIYDDTAACKYVVDTITSIQAGKKTGTITQENYDSTNAYLSAIYIDGAKISWALSDGYFMPRRSTQDMNFVVGDEVDYWLNSEGKLVYMLQASGEVTADDSTYAYVLDADKTASAELFAAAKETYYAQLILTDGTVAAVQTKADADALKGKIVSFTEKDGVYTLTDAAATEKSTTTTLAAKTLDTLGAGTLSNNNTVFVIETKDSKGKSTFTTYTGIANIPNGTAKTAAYLEKSGKVTLAYLFDTTETSAPAATTETFGFAVCNTATLRNISTEDGLVKYYEVVAFIDGKSKTIKVDSITGLTTITSTSGSEKGSIVPFFSYKVDENDIYTLDFTVPSSYTKYDLTVGKTGKFAAYADGVVGTAEGNKYVEADAPVYVYDISDKAITSTTISKVAKADYEKMGNCTGCYFEDVNGNIVCFAMIKA